MRRLRRYARVARVLGVVSLGLGMAGMFGLLERLGLNSTMGRRQRWSQFFMTRLSNALPFRVTLVAKSVDIALSSRQLTEPRHVDTILLESGLALRYTDPRRFGAMLWSLDPLNHELLVRLGPEPLTDLFDGERLYEAGYKIGRAHV